MSESGLISQFVLGIEGFAGAEATKAAIADIGEITGFAWSSCASMAESCIRNGLDVDFVQALADGWSKAEELRGYTDADKYPKSKTMQVALLDHTINTTIDPELWLVVDKLPSRKFNLTIELTTKLESAILIVNLGRIIRAELGKFTVSADLKWKSVTLPLKIKPWEKAFSASHTFNPPIQIKPPAATTPQAK